MTPSPASNECTFFGHPRGLAYLAFTEAWERFSFYGMQTLLVLYLVGQLLQPGHADTVLGLGPLRHGLETVLGPMTPVGLSSMIFGLYASFAYFLPVFGGLIGDRWLGQYRAVLLGAVLMAMGHFLMTFEAPFLIALALLIVGAGFLKGNINTQVGRLYAPEDRRRTDAYQIFSIGINVGVLTAPLVCGTLGEFYGWHYGFGAAGVGMLIGLCIYIAGRKHLPPDRIAASSIQASAKLQREDYKVIAALLVVLMVVTVFLISIGQTGSIYLLWVRKFIDRSAFGGAVPVTWFLSLTALGSIFIPPVLLRIWQWQARRGSEPEMLTKIGIGCALAGSAPLVLAAIAMQIQGGGQVAWPWLLPFHLLVTLGYLYLWPVGMALFTRCAPAPVNATFVGIYFLSQFIANTATGWLGGLYDRLSPIHFWLLHAAIGLSGALLLSLAGRPLHRILSPHSRRESERPVDPVVIGPKGVIR